MLLLVAICRDANVRLVRFTVHCVLAVFVLGGHVDMHHTGIP